ncbi:MAG: hypothetical protein H7096_05640 [Flavobacterium sp.]|nr:hypothetical protein [Pedobacter sp.]
MKNLIKTSSLLLLLGGLTALSSCDKRADTPASPLVMEGCTDKLKMEVGGNSISASSPYNVHISDLYKDANGNYVWIWEIKNENPGNGSGGTVQDLSHWGIDIGKCVLLGDIVEASYSANKTNWTVFTPEFKEDKSQDCSSANYIKFDFGTTGTASSYYKLVITKNVTHVDTEAIYKSGTNTGCGVFETCGFGCPKIVVQ